MSSSANLNAKLSLDGVESRLASLANMVIAAVVLSVGTLIVAIVILTTGGTSEDATLEDAITEVSQGLPGFENLSWETITATAQTQELNFYLWSDAGSSPRKWIDEHLTPELAELGITLNRIDAVYTGCDLSGMALSCDVTDELAAGNTDNGAVDLVWINGANFATMKNHNLLYGPFATLLPNSVNFDFSDTSLSFDHGVATEGLEFPFHTAQSVFIYDEAQIPSPPMTVPALVDWIIANPGKFAYSDPSVDFTGAAFVRTFFYYYAGDLVNSYEDLLGDFDELLYNERAPAVWEALNLIEDSLYTPSGETSPWYPDDHIVIRDHVGNGTLLMDFSFQASEASTQITDSVNPWPDTMQAYVLSSGSIADSNYLAIPVNAANKEAALTALNHIGSPGSMFVRSTPEVWGALQSFDPTAESVKEWDVAFDYILTHEATPGVEELAAGRLSDMSADWIERINDDWVTYVKNA